MRTQNHFGKNKRNRVLPILAVLAVLASVPAAIQTKQLVSAETESAEVVKPTLLRPAAQLTYDENGSAFYMENGQKLTGKFSVKPNYSLGDVDGSGSVDSRDAVQMLTQIAAQGAGKSIVSAEMLAFGDVNGDGLMNASDVTEVLCFSAASGSGQVTDPLGTAYFFADKDGMLCSGKITDTSTGDVYYAGADYKLRTGWVTDEEGKMHYCDDQGVMQTNRWCSLPDGLKGWLNADGTILKSGWLNRTEGTYYLDENGHLTVGEQVIGGQTYFFNADGLRSSAQAAVPAAGKEAAANLSNVAAAEVPVSAETTASVTTAETTQTAVSSGQTGWQEIDGKRYYINPNNGEKVTNCWLKIDGKEYCMNAQGVMLTGFQTIGSKTYYLGQDGVKQTGLVNAEGNFFYFDENGVRTTGWQTIGGKRYYFQTDIYEMAKGPVEINGATYLFGEDGTLQTGKVTYKGTEYNCNTEGVVQQTPAAQTAAQTTVAQQSLSEGAVAMIPDTTQNTVPVLNVPETAPVLNLPAAETQTTLTDVPVVPMLGSEGSLTLPDTTGTFAELPGFSDFLNLADFEIPAPTETPNTSGGSGAVVNADVKLDDSSIESLLNTCPRGETKREITVYNRQSGGVDFTIKLKDSDIAIIEQFAAEHFPENSTLAEKLYITHQWIHKNVDYAYAGAKWNAIVNKSYVDAIFNYRSGQCVQYNGAMASVLAYYGYDVYMVRGWTRPGVQHYWTECEINGNTYLVECGNLGKNGDSWQYFFKDYPNPGAYQ